HLPPPLVLHRDDPAAAALRRGDTVGVGGEDVGPDRERSAKTLAARGEHEDTLLALVVEVASEVGVRRVKRAEATLDILAAGIVGRQLREVAAELVDLVSGPGAPVDQA